MFASKWSTARLSTTLSSSSLVQRAISKDTYQKEKETSGSRLKYAKKCDKSDWMTRGDISFSNLRLFTKLSASAASKWRLSWKKKLSHHSQTNFGENGCLITMSAFSFSLFLLGFACFLACLDWLSSESSLKEHMNWAVTRKWGTNRLELFSHFVHKVSRPHSFEDQVVDDVWDTAPPGICTLFTTNCVFSAVLTVSNISLTLCGPSCGNPVVLEHPSSRCTCQQCFSFDFRSVSAQK